MGVSGVYINVRIGSMAICMLSRRCPFWYEILRVGGGREISSPSLRGILKKYQRNGLLKGLAEMWDRSMLHNSYRK